MKRYLTYLALIAATALLTPGPAVAQVHFGLPSAVKSTVKKLKKKVDSTKSSGDIVRYTLAPQTKLLNNPVSQVIGESYYFNGTASGIGTLQPGDVIISSVVSSAAIGYLRKVVDVTYFNGEYVVNTTTATLEDAFSSLYIKAGNKPISLSDVTSPQVQGLSVRPSEGGEFYLKAEDVLLFQLNGTSVVLNAELTGKASIEDFILDIPLWPLPPKIKEFKLTIKVVETGEVSVQAPFASWGVEKEKNITDLLGIPPSCGPPIWFGIIPVITCVTLVGGINLSAQAYIGVGVTQELTVSGGAHYLDGLWQPVENSFHNEFRPLPLIIKAEGTAKVYAGPQFNFNIAGIAGPFIAAHGYLETNGELLLSPPPPKLSWEAYVGVEGKFGGEVSGIGHSIAKYTAPLSMGYRVQLASSEIISGTLAWTFALYS